MKILVICKHSKNDPESKVCKLIHKKGIKTLYSWKNTFTKKELKNIDLVVSVGGDGTALTASHFLKNTPLLPINSSPKTSVGALTTTSIENLDSKFEQIIKGNFKTEKLERIEIEINGVKQDTIALNEIFIANEKAYLVSRYEIDYKNKKEEQRSSGLIFSTGTGSTAWFKSAGGNPFKSKEKFIKMIVREPYQSKLKKSKFLKARIRENEKIKVKTLTPSVLSVDSIKEYKLKKGDEVTLKICKTPLKRII